MAVKDVFNIRSRGRVAVGEVSGCDGDRLPKVGDTAFTNTGLVVMVRGVEFSKGFTIDRASVGVVLGENEAAASVVAGTTLTRLR